MLVGYARTSTLEQEAGLDAQVRDLTALGCRKLFREQVSSVGRRTQLEAAIDFYREGDALVSPSSIASPVQSPISAPSSPRSKPRVSPCGS